MKILILKISLQISFLSKTIQKSHVMMRRFLYNLGNFVHNLATTSFVSFKALEFSNWRAFEFFQQLKKNIICRDRENSFVIDVNSTINL